MPKVLISWTEPAFFGASMRTRAGWILRGLLFLAVFGGMLFGWYADQRWGNGPRMGPIGATLLNLGIAAFLTGMLEISQVGRQISISDDSVSMIGFTAFISMGTWALRSIREAELVRPEELEKPFAAMVLHRKAKPVMLGIPAAVSLPKVAAALHSVGIPVTLSGWSADVAEDTPPPAILPPEAAEVPVGSARRWTEIAQSGKALSFPHSWIAPTVSLGPGILAFAYTVGMMAYLYFYRHGMPNLQLVLLGGSALVAMMLGAGWWELFSTRLTGKYQLMTCKGVVRRRQDRLVAPDDPDTTFVGVVPRPNWTPLRRDQLSDVGFLRVDRQRRRILFEGANQRWEIPADALAACDIERIAGLKGEGDEPDGRFVVVLAARMDDSAWEAPVFPRHLAFGRGLGKKSEEAALKLQASILDILPPERRGSGS
ncbi:MAG: hypothetical protein HQ582_19350 [Planctomycetes bacterium]|nr:hypothetical protein [Planctomycetota bacterium]